ncbi:hypothetical protein D3C81_2236490 [compost metagenome]
MKESRNERAVMTTRDRTRYEDFRLTLNARFAAREPSVILITKSLDVILERVCLPSILGISSSRPTDRMVLIRISA